MSTDVVSVKAVGGYRLHVGFEDGVEGVVDVSGIVKLEGIFAPLRDPARFNEVAVHAELGTIYWPNGADLAPEALRSHLLITA